MALEETRPKFELLQKVVLIPIDELQIVELGAISELLPRISGLECWEIRIQDMAGLQEKVVALAPGIKAWAATAGGEKPRVEMRPWMPDAPILKKLDDSLRKMKTIRTLIVEHLGKEAENLDFAFYHESFGGNRFEFD